MNQKTVSKNNLILNYHVYRKKSHKNHSIVSIHGHGRSPSDFEFLSKFGKVISLQLFFHGKSVFPENRIEKKPLMTTEFLELFNELIIKENIEKFHFVAFSQGGRFVLSILPFLENRLESLQLISPDGMNNKSFYNRMSRRKWARKLFIHFEKKPKKFIRICHLATKIKLIRPKVYSFVQKFTDDPILFNRASKSWRGFRMVQPNEELIKDFFHKNPIYFKIIMGRYDQVIRTKQAVRFLKRIEQEKALIEVDCGHDFFGENFKEKLERIIQIPPS